MEEKAEKVSQRSKLIRSLSASEICYSICDQSSDSEDELLLIEERNKNTANVFKKRSSKTVAKLFVDIAPSEILEELSPQEIKRQELILELYNTEKLYVEDLTLVVEVFLPVLY